MTNDDWASESVEPVRHLALGLLWSLWFRNRLSMGTQLQEIRVLARDAPKGIAGTDFGNGAFVAIEAAVVADLEEKRAVAEAVAPFHTLGATDAELLINVVLIIGILNESPLDGGGGAQLVFSGG